MKWYDVIEGDDNRLPNCFMATKYELFGRDRFDLSEGKLIDDWNPRIRLWSGDNKWDGIPDDMMANSLGWPVFSQRLRDILMQKGIGIGDIQYLPIQIARTTGEQLHGFAVANVIVRLPALDRQKTKILSIGQNEIDPLTGKPMITNAWKAALKSGLLNGHDVIRLVEFAPPIFVSERFVEIFNDSGFTGATFLPIQVV